MDRRSLLTALGALTTGGYLIGLGPGQTEEGSGEGENGNATEPTDTPTSTPTPTPAASTGQAAPHQTTVTIDDLSGIEVSDERATISVLVGIENENTVPLTNTAGEFSVSVNDEPVGESTVDIGQIGAGETVYQEVTLNVTVGEAKETLVTAVILEKLHIGLEGNIDSPQLEDQRDISLTANFSDSL